MSRNAANPIELDVKPSGFSQQNKNIENASRILYSNNIQKWSVFSNFLMIHPVGLFTFWNCHFPLVFTDFHSHGPRWLRSFLQALPGHFPQFSCSPSQCNEHHAQRTLQFCTWKEEFQLCLFHPLEKKFWNFFRLCFFQMRSWSFCGPSMKCQKNLAYFKFSRK